MNTQLVLLYTALVRNVIRIVLTILYQLIILILLHCGFVQQGFIFE